MEGCRYERDTGINTFQGSQVKLLHTAHQTGGRIKGGGRSYHCDLLVIPFEKLHLKTFAKEAKCGVLPQRESSEG